MAKKSSRKSKKKSRKKPIPGQKSGASRRRKRADPLKSMLLGAAIFGLICAFFIIPIGGATGFSHVIRLLTPAEQPKDGAQEQAEPKGKAALEQRSALALG